MVKNDDLFGKDLLLKVRRDKDGFVKADLTVARTGDLELIHAKDAVIQAIRNRLAARQGELAGLGHPEYGSLLESVIGEPNTPDTHRIIETLVKDCLAHEPRIENILEVTAGANYNDQDCVEICVYLKLRNEPESLKLVFPFYLEGAL